MAAGDSVDVSTIVPRPATLPMGFFDGNPPRKLTAVSADNADPGRGDPRRGVSRLLMGMLGMLMRLGGRDLSGNATGSDTTEELDSNSALQQSRWLEISGTQMLALAFRPPADCKTAEVDVHVTRRSTGQTAIVEFRMDPSAAGPGCYSV